MLLAAFVSVQPVGGQTCSQSDAGLCGDAGNTRNTARTLPDTITLDSFQAYQGTMAFGESDDWYRFTMPSVTTTAGRPMVELTLFSDWGNALEFELYKQGTTDAVAEGRGSGGKYILHQADAASTWQIRVFTEDSQVGNYRFTLDVSREDDGPTNSPKDSGSGAAVVQVPLDQGRGTVSGFLTRGDSEDRYVISAPQSSVIVASLKFPKSADLELTIAPGSGSFSALAATANRAGPGFATSFISVGGVSSYHFVIEPGSSDTAGPYQLSVVVNGDEDEDPDENPDDNPPGDTSDAEFDDRTYHQLPTGLSIGNAPQGDEDTFDLVGVQVGDRIELGASSYKASAVRAHFTLELYKDSTSSTALQKVSPCAGAGGLTHTVSASGTYYAKVYRDPSCPGAAVTETVVGNYAVFYSKNRHGDPGVPGDGDAPAGSGHALPDDDEPLTAWTDPSDKQDSFSLGGLAPGNVVRVYAATVAPGVALQVSVTDSTQQSLGATAASNGGVVAFHQSVKTASTYRISINQPGQDPQGDTPYRLFVDVADEEAPPRSILQPIRLIPDDTGRTSVTLRWTPSPDQDFARYEVHAGTGGSVTPSEGTLRATVSSRPANTDSFVQHQVTGLNAGTEYTFLVRTVDLAGNSADSNTRTATTDGTSAFNQPPELSNGQVSPQQGTTSTEFTFSVRYRDPDGDAPEERRVFISGSPFVMTGSGTDYTNGVTYTYKTTLSAGNKQFYFQFSDGVASDRDPSSGAHDGPSVQGGSNRAPTNVQVSANPREGEAPLEVQFSISATDPDQDSLSYRWEFGDGGTSNAQSPKYIYDEPGDFTATGFATDGRAESSKSVTIKVFDPSNQAPTVDPTATPSSGIAPLNVQFNANAADSDGSISSYEWDFDSSDGTAVDSTQANPTHTYDSAGTYEATVKVTDNGGRPATGTVTVTVSTEGNAPPTVSINATPKRGEAPLSVSFRADGFDPDGDDLTYAWDFNSADGIQSDATGREVTHEYISPGAFTVTVRATDSEGATASATTRITVDPPPGGSGELFIEADPRRGTAPLNVSFTADTSGMPAPPRTYSWDFGDGQSSSEGPTTSHVFESEGRYEVRLNVTDTGGALYSSTIVIEVDSKGSPGFGFSAILAGIAVAAFLAVRRPRSGKDS